MTITRLKSGGVFEDKVGYARTVIAGGFVFMSGGTAQGDDIPTGIVDQCADILRFIRAELTRAGSDISKVVRVTYIIPDADEFSACWPLLSDTFGDHPPAATMISCDLIHPKYKIEIEVTALA
jgi:enamine deaminase RidA (YjgF/YER057c/UK114 family)